MRVLLVRHAEAVPEAPFLPDEQRYLTAKGRQVARGVGRKLREKALEIDAFVTSPLVRAVQTAELVADGADFTGVIEVLRTLAPGIPPHVAAAELPTRGRTIAVVGHEPGISSLGALLVGVPSFPAVRSGQAMFIEDGRAGWTIRPDTLDFDLLVIA